MILTVKNKKTKQYPKSLKRLGLTPATIVLLLAIGIFPPLGGSQYTLRLFITAIMTAILAMGFDFTNGYINICNFGYAAFWGTGAYTSAILVKEIGLSTPLGLVAAFLITAIMGVLIGCLTIRLGGIFASCMCWFISLALLALARNLVSLTGGSSGYSATFFFSGSSYETYFYLVYAFLVLIYVGLSYIISSKAGLAFRAIGMDNEAAASSGINHIIYKIFNFSLSCGIAGLIGAVYIHFVGIMTPVSMSNDKTVEIMAISFIGGRGTLWGSILCAIVLIPLLESSKNLMEWRQILYGLLMILIMIFYPRGLSGLLADAKNLFVKLIRKIKTIKSS